MAVVKRLGSDGIWSDIGTTPLKTPVEIVVDPDQIQLQEKTVTPTKSQQQVTSDNGYNALSKVTVNPIPDNYITTSDANVAPGQMLAGYSGYAQGKKVEGNIQSRAAQTITPSTTAQEIPAGVYLSGKQTISAIQTQTKTATANGTVTPDTGKYLTSVVVDVPTTSINAQAKTVTPTKSTQTVTPDNGYNALSRVTVNPIPNNYIEPSGTLNITKNGTHNVAAYASVDVNVEFSGGGFIYPDGAFAPVTSFTDGKQYALVSLIGGVYRYINTTTYNNYTMNATQITIGEDAGDYVIFGATPALFTAVASGNGFLLQNGSNYLHGTTSNGTALRVGTTQAVWTVDTSETGGFASGKYNAKEDANAVWLFNNSEGYNWSIKYETAGSFGYDRDGRDDTYSTGFTPFILYEYVAGEGTINPIVDTSDANVTADQMLAGASGYANGRKVEGNIQIRQAQTITPSTDAQYIEPGVYLAGRQTVAAIQTQSKTVTTNGTVTPDAGMYLSSVVVNVPTGGSGGDSGSGLAFKSGTTTSGTINTGLSDIEQFFIYKESQTGTGLIHLHYTKSATSRMYASAWSTQNYGTKTITNGTGGVTVNGGTLTISATQATQGALTSGVTYKWVAIGKE